MSLTKPAKSLSKIKIVLILFLIEMRHHYYKFIYYFDTDYLKKKSLQIYTNNKCMNAFYLTSFT